MSNVCPHCSKAAGSAALRGGTVQLGTAAPSSSHDWARNEREAAVCPARICETAAAQTTDPDLWMFRDFLLAPVWHSWVRGCIKWVFDHPHAAGWAPQEVEAEVVRQLRIAAINKFLAHDDRRRERERQEAEQAERVDAARVEIGLKPTNSKGRSRK